MGKHLFDYADNAKYRADITAGRAANNKQTIKQLEELKDMIDGVISAGVTSDGLASLSHKLDAIRIANHGMLVGLVDKTFERYRIEDERLAALVADGEIEAADTPGGGPDVGIEKGGTVVDGTDKAS